MNNIGALLSFCGAPISIGSLHSTVPQASISSSPTTPRVWRDGPIGLIELPVWRTSDDSTHACEATDHHVIAADARLDNRPELLKQLRELIHESEPSDARLILAAYERWGEDCASRLVGDFTFVIWDAPAKQLLAVRDPMGVRLLYYTATNDRVVIASTLGGVLAAFPRRPTVNEPLIRDYIKDDFSRWTHETAFAQVFRLPQGHRLTYSTDARRMERYYRRTPAISGGSIASRVDQFGELFSESVRSRLRGSGPIGILLSGGLDSSAVACEADRLVRRECLPRKLHSYSSIFDETPGADERNFVRCALDACPTILPTLVLSDDCWAFRELGDHDGYPLDEPDCGLMRGLFQRRIDPALRDGCRSVLTGYNGDQLLLPGAYSLPALLLDLSWTDRRREFAFFRRHHSVLGIFARACIPASVKNLVKGRGLNVRAETTVLGPFETHGAWWSAHLMAGGAASARLSQFDTFARHFGIEWRHPFMDRRLVELVLSGPPQLRFSEGVTKFALRAAQRGTVPEPVRTRRSKAHVTELTHRGLERERLALDDLLAGRLVVRAGYYSDREVDRLRRSLRSEDTYRTLRSRSKVFYLEAWLRRHRLC